MNWEKLELHVENLIPGLVLVPLLKGIFGLDLSWLDGEKIISGAMFIASAYLIGAIANITSSLLIDPLSRKGLRALILHMNCDRPWESFSIKKIKTINKLYSEAIDAGLSCGTSEVSNEVVKRRQTGRMVRSSLFPLCVFWYRLFSPHSILHACIAVFVSYVGIVGLYAYSEMKIYREGCRGKRILETKSPPGTAVRATDCEIA